MGKLDNTLIIYICGDNGTSAEGTLEGTPNTPTSYNGIMTLPEIEELRYYESWGSDKTYPHMTAAWSWAFDAPFKWTKQVASHFGGTRQGTAISWPGHITEGMIVTFGGRFGGYGLFLQQGKPVFVYNLLNLKRYRWEGGVGRGRWSPPRWTQNRPRPLRPSTQARQAQPGL